MLGILIKIGVKNLLLHKLRSFLTVLGVILGCGSVVSMLAIGEGSKREALERIRQMGASNVIIRSVKPVEQDSGDSSSQSGGGNSRSYVLDYGLKYKDLDRLMETMPTVRRALPIALLTKDARNGRRWISNARIMGTIPNYLKVKNLDLSRGRFISEVDLRLTRNVTVLSAGAKEELFGFEDPIGRSVLLGDDVYVVIGILRTQDSGTAKPGGYGGKNQNKDIYIPLSCAQRRFGEIQSIEGTGSRSVERTELHEITLSVFEPNQVSQTAAMSRKILEPWHPKNDFEIVVPLELLQQAEQEKRIWNLVLGSIAGISLLVGGIGIMNIMLASVTERTREIGIRRALGARRKDITTQFLVETVLLSSVGGILGVVVGVTIPFVVSAVADIETVISVWSIVISFGISTGIGIIFGLYPARRAAMMDPIEALRHD